MTTLQVAFLRGINLGKRRVKMEDLRGAFRDMGFTDARTLIASGNVVFSSEAGNLAARIEHGLEEKFGFAVPTILRSLDELIEIRQSDPFGGAEQTPDQKLYAWFLGRPDIDRLEVPREMPGNYAIVSTLPDAFFAIVYRQENGRFGDGLDKAGKPFEPHVTNRNWNTVLKLIELAGG